MSARLVVLLALLLAAPGLAAQARDTVRVQEPAAAERSGGWLGRLPSIGLRPRDQAAVAVPDLRGVAVADARAALARSGLVLGEVDELPVEGRAAGTVWLQRPAPGVAVSRGSAVAVMLAAPVTSAAPVASSGGPAAGAASRDAIGDAGRGSAGSASPVATPSVVRAPTPGPAAEPSPPRTPAASAPVAQSVPRAESMPAPESMPEPESTRADGPIPTAASTSDAESVPEADAIQATESTLAPWLTPPALSTAPVPTPPEQRQPPPDVAVAGPETARSLLPWLLALLALAALRRLRQTPAPTAVRARTRPGAQPRIAVDATPFAGPALRLRRSAAEPVVSAHGSPFPTRP